MDHRARSFLKSALEAKPVEPKMALRSGKSPTLRGTVDLISAFHSRRRVASTSPAKPCRAPLDRLQPFRPQEGKLGGR
jgi:hypothetical protein